MELFFLGTAAAEGYPAPFCECENCSEAREEGGKSLRLRSSILIDNDLLVDFGPDLVGYTAKYSIHFANIRDIIITHSHHDHLCLDNFSYLLPEKGHILTEPPKLNIICNQKVHDLIRLKFKDSTLNLSSDLRIIKPFETIVSHGTEVTALPAVHMADEQALFYILRKKGTTILLAFDTGKWEERVWDFLGNYSFKGVVVDETMGNGSYHGHLNISEVCYIKKRMAEQGLIGENTIFIATHISHNANPVFSKLQEIFAAEGIQAAYDGLQVSI